MTTTFHQPADSGLLSPGWADTGVRELLDDRAWLQAMLDVEVALARVQARSGVLPARAPDVIAQAARAEDFDLDELAAGVRATANPVVNLVRLLTAAVHRIDPRVAEFVHRGSTSQDILDTAMMLVSARTLRRIRDDLDRTADALAALARKHRDTPMAGRTLTQHAVPITFGLKAAGWLQLVLDARDRVDRLLAGGLPVSLGGAAGTLAAYQEYAEHAEALNDGAVDLTEPLAVELGLAPSLVPWHGVRTPLADLAGVLAFTTGALGKLAVDVQVLSRTEIGEVAEETADGRGASSAMPQKHNPVFATMIDTAVRQVPAAAAVLYQCMAVEDERSAGGWHAEWQPLREALRLTAGATRNAADLAGGLTVFPARMRENLALTGGAVVSERLNAALAALLGKAEAKTLLASATATAASGTKPLPDVVAELAAAAGCPVDADEVRALTDPEDYLGASGALVDRVLNRHHS